MNGDDYNYIVPKNGLAFIKSLPIVFRNNISTIIFKYDDYLSINDWGKYYYNKRHHLDSLLKVKNRKLCTMIFQNLTILTYSIWIKF